MSLFKTSQRDTILLTFNGYLSGCRKQHPLETFPEFLERHAGAETNDDGVMGTVDSARRDDVLEVGLNAPPRRHLHLVGRLEHRLCR